jgi:hypothetical protein
MFPHSLTKLSNVWNVYLSLKHFTIFSSFLDQIEWCLEHLPTIQHLIMFSSFFNQIEWCLECLLIIQHLTKIFSFLHQIEQCLKCLPIIQHFTKFSSFLNQIEQCLEYLPIIQHFTIFSSFINQIEWCLYPWMCKLEAYKFSLSIRSEGAIAENAGRGWMRVCFFFSFENIALYTFL